MSPTNQLIPLYIAIANMDVKDLKKLGGPSLVNTQMLLKGQTQNQCQNCGVIICTLTYLRTHQAQCESNILKKKGISWSKVLLTLNFGRTFMCFFGC